MNPLKPETLLVCNLPTTTGGVTIEVDVNWFPNNGERAYIARITKRSQVGNYDTSCLPVKLEVAKAFSFKKLQTLAAGCLLRDDVRQAIHRLCSEQGLTLLNPVF